jgi:hypothetical protein
MKLYKRRRRGEGEKGRKGEREKGRRGMINV